MRFWRIVLIGLVVVGLGQLAPVSADFVVFKVPTTNVSFVLQGKATLSKTQPLMTFLHVSKQTFDLPQGAGTEVITLPTLKEMAIKKLSVAKGNEEEALNAAVWALDHGLLPEFNRGIDQVLQLNSSHPFASQAKLLKEEFIKPLSEDAAAEAAFLKSGSGSEAKIVKSNHFMLLAPPIVNEKGAVKRKKPEVRLEQLELLFEAFVMKCAERGLPVQMPKQRFQVSLVPTPPPAADGALRTKARDIAIHWSPSQNVLFINDGTRIGSLDPIRKLQDKVTEIAAQPKARRNPQGGAGAGAGAGAAPIMSGAGAGGSGITLDALSQMSTTNLQKLGVSIQALMSIGVENFELESISRESAYLFINQCGVLPASAPQWLRDGLATYFELPSEVGWVKLGDIGQVRQAWYLASLQDPERISMADIVCGHCYEPTMSSNDLMRATTQSWALVHFLLQKHPEGITKFVNDARTLPPDVQIPDDVTMGIFDAAFGEDRGALEESWREHVLSLQPEYKALQADGDETSTAQN